MRSKLLRTNNTAAGWLLRGGLAFVLVYAAVGSLQHPVEWTGFLPPFLRDLSVAPALLKGFAAYELVLAVWLLVGKRLRWAALLAAATFAGIVLADVRDLLTTFRDVGLLCAALALMFLEP